MTGFALFALFALVAVAHAGIPQDLNCVSVTEFEPCKSRSDGRYPVCFGCDLGYFVECRNEDFYFKPCPHEQDENGEDFRLIFDPETDTCVKKTPSCKKTCVDISEDSPCDHLQNGKYHLCNMCDLGFAAKCEDNEINIVPCPHIDDGHGGYGRLLFDPLTQRCQRETFSCEGPQGQQWI